MQLPNPLNEEATISKWDKVEPRSCSSKWETPTGSARARASVTTQLWWWMSQQTIWPLWHWVNRKDQSKSIWTRAIIIQGTILAWLTTDRGRWRVAPLNKQSSIYKWSDRHSWTTPCLLIQRVWDWTRTAWTCNSMSRWWLVIPCWKWKPKRRQSSLERAANIDWVMSHYMNQSVTTSKSSSRRIISRVKVEEDQDQASFSRILILSKA